MPGTVGGVGAYDWDPDKEEVTRRRRGITFDEAEAVVLDPASVTRFDFAIRLASRGSSPWVSLPGAGSWSW